MGFLRTLSGAFMWTLSSFLLPDVVLPNVWVVAIGGRATIGKGDAVGIFSWLRGGTATLDVAEYGRFGVGRDLRALPRTIVKDLDFFGRFWIRRAEAVPAAEQRALDLCADLEIFAKSDPARFCHELRTVAEPVGGWVEYGAIRLIAELLGAIDTPDTDYLMESSLAFLRSRTIPWNNLSADAHMWWMANLPGVTWLPPKQVPLRGASPLTDVRFGEERVLATIDFNSSTFILRREGTEYACYQRYPGPDEYSEPIEFVDVRSTDLYEVYCRVGRGFSAVPDWVDPQLAPFITVHPGDFR